MTTLAMILPRSALLVLGLSLVAGCSLFTVSVKPEIQYGNPEYDSIKDLPAVKYRDETFNKKPTAPKMKTEDHEQQGDAMFLKKQFFMAFLQYDRCLKDKKDNLRLMYKKGLALLYGGKPAKAREVFALILKSSPLYAAAHEGVGRAYMKEKKYGEARACFEQAVALDPRLWRSYNYLGQIYHRQGENQKAVKEYRTAVTINPEAGFVFNNLGVSLAGGGRHQEAVDAFYTALATGYTPQKTYNNLGMALASLNAYDKALNAFKKGGTPAAAYNNLGVAYMRNKAYDRAETCFHKALELSPRFYVAASKNLKKCQAYRLP